MMLQGHFIDTLLDPLYRNSIYPAYNIWSYFRGITAPTFFTISGLVFTYLLLRAHAKGADKKRIKKGLFRGLLLLVIGYSLRVNIVSWFQGYFSPYFLVIDVLQCIGLSLILLILLYSIFKKYSYLYSVILFVIGCATFLSEPLYRDLVIDNVPLVFANFMTKVNGSVFTILPWFGYSAFGGFLATIFFRNSHRNHFRQITIASFFVVGLFLIYYSTDFLYFLHKTTNYELLYRSASFNYLFIRMGNVLILFGLFYTFEQYLKQSIISRIGEKTLSMYVIHFVLLYGSFTGYGLKRFFNQALSPWESIFGAAMFVVVVCLIAFYYAQTNHFVYNLARRFLNFIKK